MAEQETAAVRPALVDARGAGEFLGVCARTVQNLEKRGLLKSVKILRRRLYRYQDLIRIAKGGA